MRLIQIIPVNTSNTLKYTIYFDVIDNNNIALLYGSNEQAIDIIFNDTIFRYGLFINIPDGAKKIIIYSNTCDVIEKLLYDCDIISVDIFLVSVDGSYKNIQINDLVCGDDITLLDIYTDADDFTFPLYQDINKSDISSILYTVPKTSKLVMLSSTDKCDTSKIFKIQNEGVYVERLVIYNFNNSCPYGILKIYVNNNIEPQIILYESTNTYNMIYVTDLSTIKVEVVGYGDCTMNRLVMRKESSVVADIDETSDGTDTITGTLNNIEETIYIEAYTDWTPPY